MSSEQFRVLHGAIVWGVMLIVAGIALSVLIQGYHHDKEMKAIYRVSDKLEGVCR